MCTQFIWLMEVIGHGYQDLVRALLLHPRVVKWDSMSASLRFSSSYEAITDIMGASPLNL